MHVVFALLRDLRPLAALITYLRVSTSACTCQIRFEITPSYMMQRRTADVMAAILRRGNLLATSTKLLFVLRNPAKRAFSGIGQLVGRVTPQDFHDLAAREIQLLDHCYNRSLALRDSCVGRTGDEQHRRLDACVADNPFGDHAPWFQRFTDKLVSTCPDAAHGCAGTYVTYVPGLMFSCPQAYQ